LGFTSGHSHASAGVCERSELSGAAQYQLDAIQDFFEQVNWKPPGSLG
jgi:hypothetical protein